MASPLAVTVTADISGLTKGMQEAASVAQRGGGSIVAAFANVKKGADSVSDAMARFASEQRSQGRVIGYYVKELAGITGVGKEVQSVMNGLAGTVMDFATGGFVGAAIGALGLLAAAWVNVGDAGEDALEKSKEKLKDLASAAREAEVEMERLAYIKAGGDGRMFDAIQKTKQGEEYYNDLLRQRANLISQINAYGSRLRARLTENGRDEESIDRRLANDAVSGSLRDDLSAVTKQIDEIEKQRRAITLNAQVQIDEDLHTQADKAGAKNGKAYSDAFSKVMQANAAERTAWGLQQYGGRGIDGDASRRRAEMAAQEQAELEANLTKYAGGAEDRKFKGAGTDLGTSPESAIQALDAHAKRVKSVQDAYNKLGSAGGQALADIVTGHKSVGKVAQDIGQQALAMGAKWAVSQIMNAALKAGAEGAASSAQAGPAGVIAAPGVMATLFAMVSGLAGSVLTAHSGADFAGFPGEFPLLGKKDEMMLPPQDAETMRQLRKVHIEGRGQAVSVTIRANDAKSFFDYFEANPREFERRIERMRRSGGMR